MKIIGLGHYSRTGKDSFANYLIDSLAAAPSQLRAKKVPFAWKLKDIAFQLYAWAGMREPEYYETPEGAKARDIILPAIGKTPVEIWVALGTPAIRERVYDGTWIDYVLQSKHDADVLIVPDVRFPNEVAAMRKLDAVLIKVVRPGYGPRNTVADKKLLGYDGWDYVIGGSGKMEELNRWANKTSLWLRGGDKPVQTVEERTANLAVEVLPTETKVTWYGRLIGGITDWYNS